LGFCAQSVLDMNESPERLAQSRFYQRWEQVIAYQREREETATLEFVLESEQREEGAIMVYRRRLPAHAQEQFDHVLGKLKDVVYENNVRLQLWDDKRMEYIPLSRFDRGVRFYPEKDSLRIEGEFTLPDDGTPLLRLLVNIPSASLRRQSQALDDFFQDRLVNPALKNILLAPEHYRPDQEADPRPIPWSDTLDESQKRVVELALRERNIALIQGPPGAGKTTAIVEMLYQLFRQQPQIRVLVVSQQNSAVDNALGKFLSQHAATFDPPARTYRVGNPEKLT